MNNKIKNERPKPIVLIMLEGWGIAPISDNNYITQAATYLNQLVGHYPVGVLVANGELIGLANNEISNSFISQKVIGSGCPFLNINQLINNQLSSDITKKNFSKLEKFLVKDNWHLISLLSHAEIESSIEHLEKLIILLIKAGVKNIYLHGILDGRETNKNSGQRIVNKLTKFLHKYPHCHLVSLIGRVYALDEKYNFSRTAKAYDLLTKKQGNVFSSLEQAFSETYDKKIFDEEFPPTIINDNNSMPIISAEDVVLLTNHSGQGMIQLANYLLNQLPALNLITLTDYGLADKVVFLIDKKVPTISLGEVFSQYNLKQWRLANSTSFASLTMAFDSTNQNIQLDRKLVPVLPTKNNIDGIIETIKEMRQALITTLQKSVYDFIVINFSQVDTIAHLTKSGDDLIKVIKNLDDNLRLIIEMIEEVGGLALIIGTHGLAEQTLDQISGQETFTHTANYVPLYLVSKKFEGQNLGWPEAVGNDLSLLTPLGSLIDIAPTILTLANLPIPKEMTGKSLI